MDNKKIRTKEDFNNKLNEIAELFGFKFETDGYTYYITINSKKYKMAKIGDNCYFITNGSQKIFFKSFFQQHSFSTSALIELYISNGENRILCSLEQELTPKYGSDELPEFNYVEYIDGKTHSFWSNNHQVETIEADTISSPIYDKLVEYQDLSNISIDQKNKKFSKFFVGVYESWLSAFSPTASLEMINNLKEKTYFFFKDGQDLVYNENVRDYKQDRTANNTYLPFIKSINRKCLKQVITPTGCDVEIPESMKPYFMSIITNPEAIRTFNSTINYLQNSLVWPYISKHFSEQIEYVKKMQNEEYNCQNRIQDSKNDKKPFIKLLKLGKA